MKIIISPAKKMKENPEIMTPKQLPEFLGRAKTLRNDLQCLTFSELKKLLCCNDQIAKLNFERFARMDDVRMTTQLTPAILAYEGIQYQYMAPSVFTDREFDYIENHLRILSGFYGILRPFDGVTPYRLEMQAKLKTDYCSSLYDFWKDDLRNSLLQSGDSLIVNLASEEYAKAVRPWLPENVRLITPVFGEYENGKLREKGVYVKMARGEMIRFMAERSARDAETMKEFNRLGYAFSERESDLHTFAFVKARS